MMRTRIPSRKLVYTLFILIFILSLSDCPNPVTKLNSPLILNWTSYEEINGTIKLSWTSSGGVPEHSYVLQRLSAESDWLPENGVQYSATDTTIPGLIYCGTEQSYTDSSIVRGEVYIYRLFVADGDLFYSDPITITITIDNEISVIEAPVLKHIRQIDYYINLSWKEAGKDTLGYMIVKSNSPIEWNPEHGTAYSPGNMISNVSILWTGRETSYNDTDVVNGQVYYYKIFAYNADYLYSVGLQCELKFETQATLEFKRFPWVDNYMIYYGPLDKDAINTAKKYDLVIIHPNNGNITRDQVRQIQLGLDTSDPSDDVLVIAYVAVGEDLRTTKFYIDETPDYDAMLADKRFVRNGIGPRVDPRGPMPDGGELVCNYGIGDPSPGIVEGKEFASYYLDDNDMVNGVNNGNGDGKPDFNPSWRAAFVNAGDPLWFHEVDEMLYERDGIYGLQELLTTTEGRGLGVDGVFLDAMDTCAPNGWTDKNSAVQTEFEWTAPGFTDFIRRFKEKYPDKIVVQNRAVFMFRSGFLQQYLKYTTRPYIDFLLFESFRLNSSSFEDYNEQFYCDNRYNYAPPILAEATREDGFQVLSLGYAEGPNGISMKSSLDNGTYNELLIEDIKVTHNIGFRHYLSTRMVTHINNYVLDWADWDDTDPPVWSSVYNANSYQSPPGPPDPRPGLLKVESLGGGSIRVYWDIALDKYPVDYYLYYDTSPLPFATNPKLEGINRVKLSLKMPDDYRTFIGPMTDTVYPFCDDIDLTPEKTYYLCIRAIDQSPNRNMDSNQSTLSLYVY